MVKSNKGLLLKILTTVFVIFCFVSAVFAFTGKRFPKAAVAGETVEVMNEHFSIIVNSYRDDYVSDQQIVLQYDKAFTDTEVWLGNGTTGLAATNIGDYLSGRKRKTCKSLFV